MRPGLAARTSALDEELAQLGELERDSKRRDIPKRIRPRFTERHTQRVEELRKEILEAARIVVSALEVLREAAAEGDLRITFKRADDGYELSVNRMRWQTKDGFKKLSDATRGDLPDGVYLVETTEREQWLNTRPWDRASGRRLSPRDAEPLAGAAEPETQPKPSPARPAETPAQPASEQTEKPTGSGLHAPDAPKLERWTAELRELVRQMQAAGAKATRSEFLNAFYSRFGRSCSTRDAQRLYKMVAGDVRVGSGKRGKKRDADIEAGRRFLEKWATEPPKSFR
jgi:hypothetical protein